MRTFRVVFVFCFSLCAFAQQSPNANQDITFKAATEFVQVPVVVRKDGKHLGGLTKDDFNLKQDGKDQPIAAFEEIVVKPKSAETKIFSNATPADLPEITVLALDTINTPALDQANFKEELVRYLTEATPGNSTMGLVQLTRSGIHVIHDFTSDPKALIPSVKGMGIASSTKNNDTSGIIAKTASEASQNLNITGVPTVEGEVDTAQATFSNIAVLQERETAMMSFQDRASRIDTLLTLQQLAQALKGIPGRKNLIWAGSGLRFLGGIQETNGITGFRMEPGKVGEALDQHAYTWKLLNDANVAVYPIDARGAVNNAYATADPSRKYSPMASEKSEADQTDREIVGTYLAFAAQTGGKPCVYRMDLRNCIKEAVADGEAYYLLGFYVDKKNSPPGWHKIQVKLNQKASLNYRSGFVISREGPDAKRTTDLQLAMNSPFSFTALPFSGRFESMEPKGEQKTVSYLLQIPPQAITLDDAKINFDVIAIFRTLGGKEAGRMAQRIDRQLQPEAVKEITASGIKYHNKIDLPNGDYGVWFVLRDNPTGRTGSITVPIKVK